jgi:hypothetical protein
MVKNENIKLINKIEKKYYFTSIPDENCEGECGEKPRSGGGDATSLSLKFFLIN